MTAESPLVDVTQSTRATRHSRRTRSTLLPKGRDFLTLVTQAPGANQEPKSGGGIMIDGATAGENRYIIDGVETTDRFAAAFRGKTLLADFVEEVQVKSSGYTAEYAGSTGGVINAITRSGSNRFMGDAVFNWQGGVEPRRQLSNAAGETSLSDATKAGEYIDIPERRRQPNRARLHAGRTNRVEQGVVLRRLSAGTHQDRAHRRRREQRQHRGRIDLERPRSSRSST